MAYAPLKRNLENQTGEQSNPAQQSSPLIIGDAQRETVLPPNDTSQSPDDEKILKYASELFRQLGITKREPDSVAWAEDMGPDLVVVQFGEVRLPRRMMGRLTAEDWRPLLAASILYNYVLSRDKNRTSLIRLILPVGLGEIPLIFALLVILRLPDHSLSSELLWATVALWAIYSLSLLTLYTKWLWRDLSYAADRRTADTIGKEMLLSALAKYGETISATGYPRKRLHLRPTVSQRIERLQKTSDSSNYSGFTSPVK